MSTGAIDTRDHRRPTREEALAIAAERKAARRGRTNRIRRTVAIVAVAAFIGPFAVIYTQLASGRDPALATTNAVVATADSSGSTGSESSDRASTDTSGSSTSSPAAVTTQQS